jgi:hypothetical protein
VDFHVFDASGSVGCDVSIWAHVEGRAYVAVDIIGVPGVSMISALMNGYKRQDQLYMQHYEQAGMPSRAFCPVWVQC